jgi:Fe-S-cluster containining protein
MSLCATCAAGCCRRYTVGLTGYDIIRISNNLGVKPEFFLDISELTEEDYLENISRTEALFIFTDNNCKHSYRIKLKKTESLLYTETSKCIFLQEWPSEDNIIARCGIYGIRPLLCAAYPAKFVNNNRTAKVPFILDRESKYKNTPYELCSQAFTETDISLSRDEIVNLLIKLNYEIDYFKSIAERWNANPSSIEEFLHELESVYHNRVYFETASDKLKIIA